MWKNVVIKLPLEDKVRLLQHSRAQIAEYAKQWIADEYHIDLPPLRLTSRTE